MIRNIYLAGLVLLIASLENAVAQKFEPVYEDADGKSSIITPRGLIGINTANTSIRFQYFYTKSASPDKKDPTKRGRENRLYFGLDVAGSASGGISNLFSEGHFNPGTSANLILGHRSVFFSPLDRKNKSAELPQTYRFLNSDVSINDWLSIKSGIQSSSYKLYDARQPFNSQLSSQSFRGYLAQIAYTVLFNGRTAIGLSYDVSKRSNIDALPLVKFKQQRVVTDPATQTTRTFEQEVNAYAGVLQTSNVGTLSIDVVKNFVSEARAVYSINAYGRYLDYKPGSVYRSGIGFYFFPPAKSKPSKVFGGVFIESNDLTNEISNEPDFLKRIDIGITVKYLLPSLGG